ncbi:MAG: methyltransferase domain-containing protein [bacterium]
MKLNLGCGPAKMPDAVNVDVSPRSVADVIHDLNRFPWPFCDDTFDEIHASGVLEHLAYLPPVMQEIWRIARPGAKVHIWVPYATHTPHLGNPYHRLNFTEWTFDFFCDPALRQSTADAIAATFRKVSVKLSWCGDWGSRPEHERQAAIFHELNVIESMRVVLEVVK